MGGVPPHWVKDLEPGPTIPGCCLRPSRLRYMSHLGFLPKQVATFGFSCADDSMDHQVLLKMKELNMLDSFDMNKYGRIRETHAGAFEAILKYDGSNAPPRLPSDCLERAKRFMLALFRPYENSCPLTPDDEVEMPLSTHPGYEMRERGFKDKGKVMGSPEARDEVIRFWYYPKFPTVWKCAVKGGELLKRKKLDSNDPRVFLIPGIKFHWYSCKLFQQQHKLLKELTSRSKWNTVVGISFQYGGFSRRMEILALFKYILEGDATKWDSSMLPWLVFNVILPLRTMLFKPTAECSREEFYWRAFHAYFDVMYTIIVLPNGQVIVKYRGMPSGFLLTGDDNSLVHLFIVICLYAFLDKLDQFKTDQWWMLGDDHIAGTNDPEIADYEIRRAHYAKFGVTLTKEKDLVSNSPEGHTFLGFVCRLDELRHRWVPVYDYEKAMCSALKPGGRVSPGLRYVRLAAFRVLCFFDPRYETIKALALRFYEEGLSLEEDEVKEEDKTFVSFLLAWPSDAAIERLWLGTESGEVGWIEKNTLCSLLALIN